MTTDPGRRLDGTHSGIARDERSHIELRHDELPVTAPEPEPEPPPPEPEAKPARGRVRSKKSEESTDDAAPEEPDTKP